MRLPKNVGLDAIYISPWSLRDPLCQSQTLPYLQGLGQTGWRVGLVTFEQERWRQTRAQAQREALGLEKHGVHWFPLSYHKQPPVISTLMDVVAGGVYASVLARLTGARLVHGRSSMAGAAAMIGAGLARRLFFYDADGDLAQEYVDIGSWSQGSIAHRLTQAGQNACFRAADSVAVLTETRRKEVAHLTNRRVEVLPCAVDTDLFKRSEERRRILRAQLGLDGLTFVYLGKPGGWYDINTAIRIVAAASRNQEGVRLLVITREAPDQFLSLAAEYGVELIIRSAERTEVPDLLSAADAGLSVLQRLPSKQHCSPVKNGEYLACGLPIIASPGSGDYDSLVEHHRVGITLSDREYVKPELAVARLLELLKDTELPARCRTTARRYAGLQELVMPRYRRIYCELLKAPSFSGTSG
jgi:glycosyltransferase involved in cell wall biosynthesis